MDYTEYGVTELAADPFFIKWVKFPNEMNEYFWVEWLKDNPQKLETVQDARQIVLALSHDEDAVPEWELETVWADINAAIKQQEPEQEAEPKVVKLWPQRRLAAVAASFLILLLSGLLYFNFLKNDAIIYATNYGERRTIELPDGSVVVLNANSTLTVPAEWTDTTDRSVELKGEAYFSVTHKQNNQKFVVHTSDGDQVEVVGTEFNVSDRGNSKRVVLTTGKVFFNVGHGINRRIELEPGELVEVSEETGTITKKEVRTEKYTSWKENKLIFDNTSLHEVALILEEDYGYEVVLENEQIANYKITAHLDERGLDNILSTLSETLDVEVEKQDQRIIIKSY